MRSARVILLAVGMLLAGYGGWLLLSRQRLDQVLQVGEWAVAGVLLHDLVLAPLTLLVGWLGSRLLRGTTARVAGLVLLVAGTLTLVAVPALARVMLPRANQTLLDRDYGAGWLVAVAAVVLLVVLWQGLGRVRGREDRADA